jgi:hypothetical protein
MKKNLFLVGFLPFFAISQIFSENFDAAATLPSGWVAFIGTNGSGTAQNWGISTVRSFSPDNSAFVRYEAGTGGPHEDWLVTPQINLTGVTNATLTFYGGQQYTDEYASTYFVKVSTTSQTSHASFTDVANYTESNFSDVTIPALQPGDQKTISLAAYEGQQIYIAFVMVNDDGDNFYVDNVEVTGTLSTPSNEIAGFSHAYNSDRQTLHVKANTNLDDISVFNALGQSVLNQRNSDKEASFNLSSFANGVYVVKVVTDNQTETFKIIKN